MTEWIPMETQPEFLRKCWVDDDIGSLNTWRITHPDKPYATFHIQPDSPHFEGQVKDLIRYGLCPFAVGEIMPEKEEWRVVDCRRALDNIYRAIEYRDGKIVGTYSPPIDDDWSVDLSGDWQPAETMPDFAVRKHSKVVSVEHKQIKGFSFKEYILFSATLPTPENETKSIKEVVDDYVESIGGVDTWGWLITTEEASDGNI